MATYLMFGKYSQEALDHISAERSAKAIALLKELGAETRAGYALMGEHDLVLVVEFPDNDERASGFGRVIAIARHHVQDGAGGEHRGIRSADRGIVRAPDGIRALRITAAADAGQQAAQPRLLLRGQAVGVRLALVLTRRGRAQPVTGQQAQVFLKRVIQPMNADDPVVLLADDALHHLETHFTMTRKLT